MLHNSSNRATPTGENITKLVRQNYKPVQNQVYSHEMVTCRTDITCQKGKPEDYWNTNFRRRKANLQKGFYSSSTEPYKPIGGQLILDPCELVLSALPGSVDKKIGPRMRRRGTIYEELKTEAKPSGKEKNDDASDSFTSLDLVDTAPSAGYDDIKKLLRESRQRIICVRAGKWYEDHVKDVEEASNAEMEANKPEDTGMVLKSVSSICLSQQATKSSKQTPSEQDSGKSSRKSSGRVSICEVLKTPSPLRSRDGSGRSTLKAPSVKKNKISLLQVSTGIASILNRKERQFKDHHLFLKSIFNCLTALHNLKVRDIRSKVPLSREVVEKLQKEHGRDEEQSRGTYVSRGQGKHRGASSFRSGFNSRRTSIAEASSELGDFLQDDLSGKRRSIIHPKLNPGMQGTQRSRRLSTISYNFGGNSGRRTSMTGDPFSDYGDLFQDDVSPRKQTQILQSLISRGRGTQASTMQMEGDHGHYPASGRMSIFATAQRANTVENATRNVFGRRSKGGKTRLTGEALSALTNAAKKAAIADTMDRSFVGTKQSGRSKGGKARPNGEALSTFTNAAKKVAIADSMYRSFVGSKQPGRKSRNAANISNERQPLETWEDLLNYQPEPYVHKEKDIGGGMCFGVITKFMRWYRKISLDGSAESEGTKRRASIIPQHGAPPHIDKTQLSHLHDIHEKGMASDRSEKGERESSFGKQGERESSYVQQRPGSSVQITDRVRRLPIWQQVAQEKSTVFQETQTAPNPDTSVQRCRQNLNKLKRSVQKENTATLEKIVRERVANFRLKLGTLNAEESSPLFCEQKLKLQDVKDNVNKSHLENFDVQPSKWYEELKEKTVSITSSYNQPDIQDMLTKLQTYAHMDNKTLSFSKAKLCLLMMSLPAYDICQIYMQKALKFIFENIMLGQEAQFYEWLNHRKIPYMIVSNSISRSGSPRKDMVTPTKDT